MANKLFEIIHPLREHRVLNGIRVKPAKSKDNETGIDSEDTLVHALDGDKADIIGGIQAFRELSQNRNEQYDAFDEMEKDATISAALKMYADDATQYNLDGDVIWAESEDPTIAEFANRLIRTLQINKHAWEHIYNLVKYGDIYLETFYDDEYEEGMNTASLYNSGITSISTHKLGARMEEYIEMVANPASIFDLRLRGNVAGFIKIDEADKDKTNVGRAFSISLTGTNQRILPSDKYVHIMLSGNASRYPEVLDISFGSGDSARTVTYTVAKGKTMLEDVFKSYRELSLMEDSILLNRVTRSAITRILQVEVGDMPKNQVRERLRKIKQMIEQHTYMDKDQKSFSNMASPGPIDNTIYVPTRQGNGAITSTTLGGDVDPKSLIDIEYYQQKEAGGLGIPLSYLRSQSGDGGGLSSGTALTKLDNRYARTVKRIQTAYIEGITQLLNIFALRKGLANYIGQFKVRMLSPSTIEDADRDEQLQNRIRMADDLLSIIQKDESLPAETVSEITIQLMSTFLNKPEIAKVMQDAKREQDEKDANMNETEFEEKPPTDDSFDFSEDADEFNDIGAPSSFREEPLENEDFDEPMEDEVFDEILGDAVDLSEPESDFGDFEEFA